MTRERDRIQENANRYIVRNCPSICFGKLCSKPFLSYALNCQDCTDCVVKQVIEECDKIIIYTQNAEIDVMLERSGITDAEKSELYGQCKMARKILNLFDIEEIKK